LAKVAMWTQDQHFRHSTWLCVLLCLHFFTR